MTFGRRLEDQIQRQIDSPPGGGAPAAGAPPPGTPAQAPSTGGAPPAPASGGTAPASPPAVNWTVEGPRLAEQMTSLRQHAEKLEKENAGFRSQNRGQLAELSRSLAQMAGLEIPPGSTQPPDANAALSALQGQMTELQKSLRTERIDSALKDVYAKHGVIPDLTKSVLTTNGLLSNADPSSASFKHDLDTAVEKLAKDYPSLKIPQANGPQPPRQTTAPMTPGSTALPQLTLEEVKAMKPEEVEAARKNGQLDTLLGRHK